MAIAVVPGTNEADLDQIASRANVRICSSFWICIQSRPHVISNADWMWYKREQLKMISRIWAEHLMSGGTIY